MTLLASKNWKNGKKEPRNSCPAKRSIISAELKLDGLAVSLVYEKGFLSAAPLEATAKQEKMLQPEFKNHTKYSLAIKNARGKRIKEFGIFTKNR